MKLENIQKLKELENKLTLNELSFENTFDFTLQELLLSSLRQEKIKQKEQFTEVVFKERELKINNLGQMIITHYKKVRENFEINQKKNKEEIIKQIESL